MGDQNWSFHVEFQDTKEKVQHTGTGISRMVKRKGTKMNEEYHSCHFCGAFVKDGYETDGTRHYLSDCRPDLVEHEPGKLCTWPAIPELGKERDCYAHRVMTKDGFKVTDKHENFYKDGPT